MLLASSGALRPSILQVRTRDVLPSHIGMLVLRAIERAQAHIARGAIVTVDEANARIRVLPVR